MNFEATLVAVYACLFILGVFLSKWGMTREKMQKAFRGQWIKWSSILIWVGLAGLYVLPDLSKVWISLIFLMTLPAILRWVCERPPKEEGDGLTR